jgi:hypothetical protein
MIRQRENQGETDLKIRLPEKILNTFDFYSLNYHR